MSEFFSYFALNYWHFLWVFLRLSAFFLAFPFFSTPFVPVTVRVVLLIAFSFFFSGAVPGGDYQPASTLQFFLLAVKELLFGAALALVGAVFYSIVVYGAELISYMMGITVANLFDPTFGMVSVLGRLFAFTFYGLFFVTGGERLFLGALYKSFESLPVGAPLPAGSFYHLVKLGGLIFYLGFKMSFPFIFALFVTNLALALVNRLIPQINVFIVGLPLQVFVGLLLLSVGFSVVVYFTVNLVERYIEELFNLIGALKGG
jgi:flagellar biosynthetic protein FliR